MTPRFEYHLNLNDLDASSIRTMAGHILIRPVDPVDLSPLAELMLDAYQGTIDFDGETIQEARQELESYFQGTVGVTPLLKHSLIAADRGILLSACLVSKLDTKNYPWISYVITARELKNHGLGTILVAESLMRLKMAGYHAVGAMITEGNLPSERLFSKLGFQAV